MNEDELLTVDELARWSKLSVSKIYADVETGAIPFKRWGKQRRGNKTPVRFFKPEILKWLNDGCPRPVRK